MQGISRCKIKKDFSTATQSDRRKVLLPKNKRRIPPDFPKNENRAVDSIHKRAILLCNDSLSNRAMIPQVELKSQGAFCKKRMLFYVFAKVSRRLAGTETGKIKVISKGFPRML